MSNKRKNIPVINIDKFDVKQIHHSNPFTMLVLAPKGCGKSQIIKRIMHSQRHRFYYGLICSQTEPINHFYEKFCPKILLKDKFQSKYSTMLLDRGKKLENDNVPTKFRQTLAIVDDCITDFKTSDLPTQKLMANGRHYKISLILSSQYPNKVPTIWRENFDYVFIGGLRTKNAFDSAFGIVQSVFENLNTFKKYIRKYTKGHSFLVVDVSVHNYEDDQNSDSSYDSVVDMLDNIKKRVFYFTGDINLITKCFPDHLRTSKEKTRYIR
jgi:hypothetical protein